MRICWRSSIAIVLLSVACTNDQAPAKRGAQQGAGKRAEQGAAGPDAAAQQSAKPAPDANPYWPRFHGPDGSNRSADVGLLKQWPEGGPPLVWTATEIGHGFSGVTLSGGQIFTSGNIDGKTVVTALGLDGKVRWQTPNGPAWTKDYPGSRGTPTWDEGRIYHQSPLGNLICLDAATGGKIWSCNPLEQFDAKDIRWALAESVLIDGTHVISCPGGKKASVVAFDAATGKVAWTAPSTGKQTSYASPSLAEYQGLSMILTMNAKALIGVNADDGDLLFEFPHVTKYDINALMPLYHDGHIFISSGYKSGSALLKVTVNGKQASVEQVWHSDDLDNHHGGVILLDGYLYGAASNRNQAKWICLDWQTGAMQYAARGVGKGSLTYADGMLYTLSEKRKMGLVGATPAGHEVVSQFTVPSGGEGASWAHPVVCGGRLYIRHGEKLYAYDVKD